MATRKIPTVSESAGEAVMLGIRTREGVEIPRFISAQTTAGFVADGLLDGRTAVAGHIVPTLRDRPLANAVTRHLWKDLEGQSSAAPGDRREGAPSLQKAAS